MSNIIPAQPGSVAVFESALADEAGVAAAHAPLITYPVVAWDVSAADYGSQVLILVDPTFETDETRVVVTINELFEIACAAEAAEKECPYHGHMFFVGIEHRPERETESIRLAPVKYDIREMS